MENEIWKDVVGYEGLYQVSNLGRVKSLARTVIRSNGVPLYCKEKVLKTAKISGYPLVDLRKKGNRKVIQVHRLICLAFLPNPENKPQVNHKNGVKTDNRLENLEWATRSENSKHAFLIGLNKPNMLKGEKIGTSKLTEKQVIQIKHGNKGLTRKQISAKYGIDPTTVSKIILGKSWKHI